MITLDDLIQLEKINNELNNGRSSLVVARIITLMHAEDTDAVKQFWLYEGDKIFQYPEVYELLRRVFGERG